MTMFDNDIKKSSGELYVALCKSKRNPIFRPKADDVCTLIETIQKELFFGFESEFLDACYAIWLQSTQDMSIADCSYNPRTFRLTCSNAPYALSSYDAYIVFKQLADAVTGEDYHATAEKWLSSYLGKKLVHPNPEDHQLDALLEQIDEGLLRMHQGVARQQAALDEAIRKEDSARKLVQAATAQATEIVEQARNQSATILANSKLLEQQGVRLRQEGEMASRKMYAVAEEVHRQRTQQAQELLDNARNQAGQIMGQAQEDANQLLQDARNQAHTVILDGHQQAAETVALSKSKAEEITAKAKARANEITQQALDDKYAAQHDDLKDGMDMVVRQFTQVQEAMRALEGQFAQQQLMKIFNTYYSLYDLIDLNRRSLQTLPEEYIYICENMDTFLEIIQEGLADFGVQTFVTAPQSPFSGKLHEVQNSKMFDPATAVVKTSLRPGFLNTATGNVLQKEYIEIANP